MIASTTTAASPAGSHATSGLTPTRAANRNGAARRMASRKMIGAATAEATGSEVLSE